MTNPIPFPSFAAIFQKTLIGRDLNPRSFAAKMAMPYDSVRKVSRGEAMPGTNLLGTICKELQLDYEEMALLVKKDREIALGPISIELEGDNAV